jgi:transposase
MTSHPGNEARRLRAEEGLSFRQIQQRLGVGKDRLRDWLRGVPAPDWTRRPRAKDELRERAVALREGGSTVDEIAAALGVSKSSAYVWTRHVPFQLDPAVAAPGGGPRPRPARKRNGAGTDGRWLSAGRSSRSRRRRRWGRSGYAS